MDTPGSRDAVQRDLNEPEDWPHVKFVRDNQARYKALNLGQSSPWCQYRLGDEQIDSSPAKKNVLVDEKLDVSQQRALTAQKAITHPGLHPKMPGKMASRTREVILPLYFSLVGPHL